MTVVVGVLSAFVIIILSLLFAVPAALLGLVKLAVPSIGPRLAPIFEWFVRAWAGTFCAWLALFSPAIEVSSEGTLSRQRSYLLLSNHKSWVDIFVLFKATSGVIPATRFFMKQELLWIPLIGFVAWSMDFPVMKRYSKEYLAKNPSKRGGDLATVRKACARLKNIPVTIVNFSEGTRATPAKLAKRGGDFEHLLPPKAGGVATVMSAMSDQLDGVIDATIAYPDGVPSFWDWMCGKGGRAQVHMQRLDMPKVNEVSESGQIDAETRESVKSFLLERWQAKDARLKDMLSA